MLLIFSPCSFYYFFLFCTFSVLIIMYCGKFFSGFFLFGNLYASYTLIGISFFRLGKFTSVILLKVFFISLIYISSSFISIICSFDLSIVSQTFCMFCAYIYFYLLDVTFSLTEVFDLVFSTWVSVSMSCNLLVILTSEVFVWLSKFFIFRFILVYVFFSVSISLLDSTLKL